MDQKIIYINKYEEPEISRREIARYMGCKSVTPDVDELIDECLNLAHGVFTYNVCYSYYPIEIKDNVIDFSFMKVESRSLAKNLRGCDRVILMGATVGLGIDRLIAKYGRLSPSKALCMQAIGAERIEALCDLFCRDLKSELKEKGLFLRPRFSPGYGDLELSMQKNIFKVLDCQRKIGLTLNESLLMSPSKSVTAIIGVSTVNSNCHIEGCENCTNSECEFRR